MSARLRRVRLVGAAAGAAFVFGLSAPFAGASPAAVPVPGTITVQTIPALAGVHFSLDALAGVTGTDGSATVADPRLAEAAQRLQVPDQQVGAGQRVTLDRVVDVPHQVLAHRLLLVELDQETPVSITVQTPEGSPEPLGQVSSMTLQDSLGRTLTFSGQQLAAPVWLAALRPVPNKTGLTAGAITYTVTALVVHGSNIVNSGHLRFAPARSARWTVPGLFFTLTVRGDDLLRGQPAGTSLRLVYPDHFARTVALDARHQARLTDLPRGDYVLQVRGGLLTRSSHIRLSRSQTVNQLVVTKGDAIALGLVVAAGMAVLVGISVLGRHLRQTRQHRWEPSGAFP